MTLPKITHPIFKITIPSTKKTLSFRPYTVKEEKLLLMIDKSENLTDSIDTLKQIINNCCVDSINVDKLAVFDIEYIFIKLRSKSVGEQLELVYNIEGDKRPFVVDLEKVEVKFNPEHKQKFVLAGDVGVSMNYPNFDSMLKLEKLVKEDSDVDQFVFDMFIDCIDTVFDDNKVYDDFSREEIEEFVLSLPSDATKTIRNFFETMPVLEHTVQVKKKDGSTEKVVLRGLKDFFIF